MPPAARPLGPDMAAGRGLLLLLARILALAASAQTVQAHDHHGANLNFDTGEPIGGALKAHILLMSVAFGVLFPVGLVLGLRRHKWHVPVQATGTALAVAGFVLGHVRGHGGRAFPDNAHSKFSWFMLWLLAAQAGAGVYLKLHTERRFKDRARPYIRIAHRYMAPLMVVATYAQVLMGVVAWLGFCFGDFYGQCLAHLIMGSSFLAYGIWLLLLLRLAGPWLASFGRSPEFYDSAMIMVWGLFNTFTEHGFVEEAHGWSHKDLQHTSLGVIWFCGGLLSTYMLRKADAAERSFFPAIILMVTGCAMGSHEQDTQFSTRVHFVFGLSLVLAGLARCIEILLITTGLIGADRKEPNPFQYLSVFMLCHSGVMFMSANRENVSAVDQIGVDIGTFSLGYMSVTFLLFLYAYFMMQLFAELGKRKKKHAGRGAAGDGPEYRTLSQMSQAGDEDAADSNPHVLFDAAADEERDAAAPGSPRPSDDIELSPMRLD
ncbi:hypothetical protein LPJ61_002137 [Coemansia biformis]|uniref:Cytochrome b561 domain-containing protein n=1 Tax=Coemansia biformis TaxID=1286918 RepID=A0A9W7Y8V5_9FUNG|nr:hypothetical protein LPJ61_002137 [Coemansia biformis]